MTTKYDALWDGALDAFAKNEVARDPCLLDPSRDARRGLTVLGRLGEEVSERICAFLDEGRSLEPDQYYYPRQDFHLTILSIITCRDGFDVARLHKQAYLELIAEAVARAGPIRVLFKGITASSACVMVQGFPLNDDLAVLRGQLRQRFKASGLEHSIDQRYTLDTAHSTVIRFKAPFADQARFVEYLKKYRDSEFGAAEIPQIEFVHNNWYMSNSMVSRVGLFTLGD